MNRTQLSAFRSRARVVSESLYPATVRIGNPPVAFGSGADRSTDVACSTSGLKKTQSLGAGAFFQQEIITFRVRKDLLATALADPTTELLDTPLLWIRTGFEPMPLLISSVNDSAELFHTLGCTAPPQ